MYTETELIQRVQAHVSGSSAIVGIGDDTAVVRSPRDSPLLLCSDLLVEGTHFRRDTHPAASLGYKSIAINVSDIGAMGGTPLHCLLSLAVPKALGERWIEDFLDGLQRACRQFDVELVGGDTSEAQLIFIDVSMTGELDTPRAVCRSGAQPGDGVYVTGTLGGSALGLGLLGKEPETHPAIQRHLFPTPRHQAGRALAALATAMIDVSDGLSKDLGHILEASGVAARIDSRLLPRAEGASLELALHGGEDYELILTGTGLPDAVEDIPITRIGEITARTGDTLIWLLTDSGEQPLPAESWEHFT